MVPNIESISPGGLPYSYYWIQGVLIYNDGDEMVHVLSATEDSDENQLGVTLLVSFLTGLLWVGCTPELNASMLLLETRLSIYLLFLYP